MKRFTKQSIFLQIMLFSAAAVYTIFKDKQELMIFATGNIYRETGTASKEVEDKQYSMKLKSEDIALEKGRIRSFTQRQTKNSRSTVEVELKDRKTRDRIASRNSWAEIYKDTTALRKSAMLLGQEVETDDGLMWRVKWGQRGADSFGCSDAFYCWAQNYCYSCICILGAIFIQSFTKIYH